MIVSAAVPVHALPPPLCTSSSRWRSLESYPPGMLPTQGLAALLRLLADRSRGFSIAGDFQVVCVGIFKYIKLPRLLAPIPQTKPDLASIIRAARRLHRPPNLTCIRGQSETHTVSHTCQFGLKASGLGEPAPHKSALPHRLDAQVQFVCLHPRLASPSSLHFSFSTML